MFRQIIIVPTVLELMLRGCGWSTWWNLDIHSIFMLGCSSALLYDSSWWRTQMQLPNIGRGIVHWLSYHFIQCDNLHVLTLWSITASIHKFMAVVLTMRQMDANLYQFVFVMTGWRQRVIAVVLGHVGGGTVLHPVQATHAAWQATGNVHYDRSGYQEVRVTAGQSGERGQRRQTRRQR